jgi:hypothetical protein
MIIPAKDFDELRKASSRKIALSKPREGRFHGVYDLYQEDRVLDDVTIWQWCNM